MRELPSNKEILKSTFPNLLVTATVLIVTAIIGTSLVKVAGVLYAIVFAQYVWEAQKYPTVKIWFLAFGKSLLIITAFILFYYGVNLVFY